MITLEWPWALALVALPWVVRRVLPAAHPDGGVTLPIGDELERIAGQPRLAARVAPPLMLLAWVFLIAAAAQPTWVGAPLPLPVVARDLVLLLDVSASMADKDVDPMRPERSRLEVARELAAEFLDRREGDRVGLVVFGTQAYLYAPLTVDRRSVATMLAEMEVGLAGDATAIGDAIVAGIKATRASRAPSSVLVLLTDGENTAGSVPPAKAAELAASTGIRVHVIGFGADVTPNVVLEALGVRAAPVPEAPLKELAQRTDGRFFRARSAAELREVYEALDRIEPVSGDARTFVPKRTLFQWLLAAALLAAIGALAPQMVRR